MITLIVIISYLLFIVDFFKNMQEKSITIFLSGPLVVLIPWYVDETWGIISVIGVVLSIAYLVYYTIRK